MPIYQNSTVDQDKLIIGNYTVEVAASAAATFVNVGAGILNSFNHNTTPYDAQAGNAPDPIEGIANEVCVADMEMIEYDSSVISIIQGGLIASSTSSSVETIHAGGYADTTITPKAWRLTNTRTISGATIQSIITVYYATPDAGPQWSFKSDNDTDPVAVMPLSITGKLETSRAPGDQLYKKTRTVVP